LDVEHISSDSAKTFHQKYFDIYRVLHRRDKEIGQTFNNLRRSTALVQLASMKGRGLVTQDEFLRFSQETQDAVKRILEVSDTDFNTGSR
jgi:hypothetical protein